MGGSPCSRRESQQAFPLVSILARHVCATKVYRGLNTNGLVTPKRKGIPLVCIRAPGGDLTKLSLIPYDLRGQRRDLLTYDPIPLIRPSGFSTASSSFNPSSGGWPPPRPSQSHSFGLIDFHNFPTTVAATMNLAA